MGSLIFMDACGTGMVVLAWLYRHMIFAPFLALYVHGPRLAGYGFWSGRDQADICAAITTLPGHVFSADPLLCEEVIRREAHSLIVTCGCVAYFYSVLCLLLCVQNVVHACVRRAVLGRFEEAATLHAPSS